MSANTNSVSRLFGAKYFLASERYENLVNKVIVDKEAQRKLSVPRAKKIAEYIISALNGETMGAFFSPLLASERPDGKWAVGDGQHRWNGFIEAVSKIEKEIMRLRKKAQSKKLSEDEISDIKTEIESLTRIVKAIGASQIPIMVYQDLSIDMERQLFHDINNFAIKPPKSLSLSFDTSNPFIWVAKEALQANKKLAELTDRSPSATTQSKLEASKLFLFSTVYQTVEKFLGKKAFKDADEDRRIEILQDVNNFFTIYLDSLPEDFLDESKFLYRDAKVIQGVAMFAKQMGELKGVDWQVTLAEALKSLSFENKNHLFATIGGASKTDDGKIFFRGTSAGTGAVNKTLSGVAKRLDKEGVEVNDAYLAKLAEVEEELEEEVSSEVLEALHEASEQMDAEAEVEALEEIVSSDDDEEEVDLLALLGGDEEEPQGEAVSEDDDTDFFN